MKNINEMTDLEITHRLDELDPMEFELTFAQREERMHLIWARHLRNREDSARARMMGHG